MTEASPTDHRRSLGILGMASIGVVAVQSWFGLCLQDDAYISFRYARNAALGHGLVYNPGEPVEGYTNFLWTALFIPVELLGLDPGDYQVQPTPLPTGAAAPPSGRSSGLMV